MPKLTHRIFLPFVMICLSGLLLFTHQTQAQEHNTIVWHDWSDALFEQAKRENKLVILDVEAVWCHWCHVMDEKTYHDPTIVKLVQQSYIAIRVDQDAHPDISIRYEDYGWPATVIFGSDGRELVKLSGYIPPERMEKLLQRVVNDPRPSPSIAQKKVDVSQINATENTFSAAQRQEIISQINRGYDTKMGGWGNAHKFILAQNVEYALIKAQQGDKGMAQKARETLDKALALIDPVWGGVYQYSDRGRWDSPHFEKIMVMQADDLRLYSLAYKQFKDTRYLKAAKDIVRYLTSFLSSPEGAFYTSQDADVSSQIDGHVFYALDDQHRRKMTMPRIDKNIYARENGWAITSLASFYDATGDLAALNKAISAAHWVEKNRSLTTNNARQIGFKHGEMDRAGPYLGDSLAMGQAYLALYTSTADKIWLTKAAQVMTFIHQQFKLNNGYVTVLTAKNSQSIFKQPLLQMEENVALARLANQLHHYTGEAQYKNIAEHAVKYLVTLANSDYKHYLAGALLAADELASDPAHITIVGAKSDAQARALFQAALQYPVVYRRVEWWDKAEGAMPNTDVQYPQLAKAAAFICVNNACSIPIYSAEKISAKADSLLSASHLL